MIELRWIQLPDGNKNLEYRVKEKAQHISLLGNYQVLDKWSDWKQIPTIKSDEYLLSKSRS